MSFKVTHSFGSRYQYMHPARRFSHAYGLAILARAVPVRLRPTLMLAPAGRDCWLFFMTP